MRRIAIDTNIYTSFKCNDQSVVEAPRDCDLIGVDIWTGGGNVRHCPRHHQPQEGGGGIGETSRVLDEGLNYIEKPFTVEGLARRVREVLDS